MTFNGWNAQSNDGYVNQLNFTIKDKAIKNSYLQNKDTIVLIIICLKY